MGLIADEQLPEDLQPEKNPLAADPDDQAGDEPATARPSPRSTGCPTWDSRAPDA